MDLIPVIGEALRMVRPRAETKSIELQAALPEEAIISTSEIAGTTFVVELPLVQTDAHPDHPR